MTISFSNVLVRDHISELYRKMLSNSVLKIDSFVSVLHSFSESIDFRVHEYIYMKKRALDGSPCGDPISDLNSLPVSFSSFTDICTGLSRLYL